MTQTRASSPSISSFLGALFTLFLVAAPSLSQAMTAKTCIEIFASEPLDPRLEKRGFNGRETAAIRRLTSGPQAVSLSQIIIRFDEIKRYAEFDRRLTAPPIAMLRLAQASLRAGLEMDALKNVIHDIGQYLNVKIEGADGIQRTITIPSRILLGLTELKLTSGESGFEVATIFNRHLLEVSALPVDPTSHQLPIPVNLALAATIAQLKAPAKL